MKRNGGANDGILGDFSNDAKRRCLTTQTTPTPTATTTTTTTTTTTGNNGNHPRFKVTPFLPCHLRMLQTLYRLQEEGTDTVGSNGSNDEKGVDTTASAGKDGVQSQSISNEKEKNLSNIQVENEIWNYVKLFLTKRSKLQYNQQKTRRLNQILQEAKSLQVQQQQTQEELVMSQGNDMYPNSHHTTMLAIKSSSPYPYSTENNNSRNGHSQPEHQENDNDGALASCSFDPLPPRQDRPSYSSTLFYPMVKSTNMVTYPGSSSTTTTTNRYPRKSPMMPTRTPTSNFNFTYGGGTTGNSMHNMHHSMGMNIAQDTVDSLGLVTQILQKRHKIAIMDSQSEQEPFTPLLVAITRRIQELEITISQLKHTMVELQQNQRKEMTNDDFCSHVQHVQAFQNVNDLEWDVLDSSSSYSSLEEGECGNSNAGSSNEEEENSEKVEEYHAKIAIVQSKLGLWNLLRESLVSTLS